METLLCSSLRTKKKCHIKAERLKSEIIHPLFSGLKLQTGVSESFFDENMELSNLRNQVSELQFSRDSLQEQMTTKDEKIEKLVGHLFSQI